MGWKNYLNLATAGIAFTIINSCGNSQHHILNSKWECTVTSFSGHKLLYSDEITKGDLISLDLVSLQKANSGTLEFKSIKNSENINLISYLNKFDKDRVIRDNENQEIGIVLISNKDNGSSIALELHTHINNNNTAHASIRVIQDVTMSMIFLNCKGSNEPES